MVQPPHPGSGICAQAGGEGVEPPGGILRPSDLPPGEQGLAGVPGRLGLAGLPDPIPGGGQRATPQSIARPPPAARSRLADRGPKVSLPPPEEQRRQPQEGEREGKPGPGTRGPWPAG